MLRQVWTLWRKVESSAAVRAVARAIICLYFANEVLDSYQRWQHTQTPEMQQRFAAYPHRAVHTRCVPHCSPTAVTLETVCLLNLYGLRVLGQGVRALHSVEATHNNSCERALKALLGTWCQPHSGVCASARGFI